MKFLNVLNWLVALIFILSLTTALCGLFLPGGEGPFPFTSLRGSEVQIFGRGLYQYDTLLVGAALRGTDAVTLLLSLPLLVFSYLKARHGNASAPLLVLGLLFYFLYYAASLAFSAAFNPLFLVYTALFSASLFAVLVMMTTFEVDSLAKLVKPNFPHRSTAIFLFTAGFGTLLIWLSEITPALLKSRAPDIIGTYTTLFTHAFDSAVITPAAVIAAIALLKRKPLGYLLGVPILILCALIGAVVISQTIFQALEGLIFPLPTYVIMIGTWIVMGIFAISLTISSFRNLSQEKRVFS